ncbi:hypothetical protein F2Q68_00027832 [Brassica cretica]|uniref:Uncharacterized protein n=1 Tax=Brassica cretica TaxID=69181 RepID=A0A8S9I738_BRACR|nr:hypothetical protein F2Q68_00027832 [Brassica cretica]
MSSSTKIDRIEEEIPMMPLSTFHPLLYKQLINLATATNYLPDLETSLIFPNLIYQLLVLQKEVPLLPGDEEPIGRGLPIYGVASDTSGPRGRRRLT